MNATEAERPPTYQEAVRLLWDEAASRPEDGLGEEDVAHLLRDMTWDDRHTALRVALRRFNLVAAWRVHGVDERHKDGTRYFVLGRRP